MTDADLAKLVFCLWFAIVMCFALMSIAVRGPSSPRGKLAVVVDILIYSILGSMAMGGAIKAVLESTT